MNLLGYGFDASGAFTHQKNPATTAGTRQRIEGEIGLIRKEAIRTVLHVEEATLGASTFNLDDLARRGEQWLQDNLKLLRFTARIVAGANITIRPVKRVIIPPTDSGVEVLKVSVGKAGQGVARFSFRSTPAMAVLAMRALQGDVEVMEQESLFFLDQRLQILNKLGATRHARELSQPSTLPRPVHTIQGHQDLLSALPEGGVGIVVGPPGTGKTQTISDLALQIQQGGGSCLLLSWTRVAVEEALERVLERDGSAARLGETKAGLPKKGWDDEHVDYQAAAEGPAKIPVFGDRAGEASLLGATFLQAFLRFNAEYTKGNDQFDVVLVDEASQVPYEAVLFARRAGKRVVLLGDPLQLPPVYRADERLDSWVLDEAEDCLSAILNERSDLHVLLGTQYRSLPGIMDWSNQVLYGGNLRNGRAEDGKALRLAGRDAPRVWLLPVAGEQDNNRHNPNTLRKAIALVRSAARQLPGLGLPLRALYITPYRRQAKQAEAGLEGLQIDLTVGTVDASQGKQAPLVVFDLCAFRETQFWASPVMARRFNVALTRATHHLVILAPEALLQSVQIPWLRSLLTWAHGPLTNNTHTMNINDQQAQEVLQEVLPSTHSEVS